ncbi:hypothetical protein SAMN04489727_2533 [Amycolatopsis tolypomycina]|uniref:IrrE N-terminal-like domain-containing protein n=1 Tax=Amycolatopsis tolypomycina TaxID=208445 RepID=A0A1H4PPS8_9PSEU|nr:hypothetical protein [Amycolatopsis tolypomycina]SEC09365.1 hypothetical protein SAMN04489727_2533 [Amycolatopsis tolypomycina]
MARPSWRRQPARSLWQRARQVADAVSLPEPFDAEAFVARLAAERGRPIELMPVSVPAEGAPCGLLMSTERADYILYPTGTTALHRRHILLHEVGHLLCGHVGSDAGADGVAIDAAGRQLMPNLSPELVRRVLGRTTYSAVEEREAELVASLLAQRVVRTAEPREPAPGVPEGVRRFDSVFGGRPRRRTP